MAITDIQFSEELQAGAPSIKYRGNEGPQSPQEEQQMVGQDYSSPQYRMQLIEKLMAQGLDFGAASNEADRLIKLMLDRQRQGSAYGGIAGLDGRRRYGLGSKLKKFVRKVIPNEVADIAVTAAPFIAPFNPLIAAGMAGLGGFDQHGSLSRGLKSGLMTYGGGQLARGIGGGMENLQGNPFKAGSLKGAFQVPGGGTGWGKYFSSPIQDTGGVGGFLDKRKTAQLASEVDYTGSDLYKSGTELAKKQINTKTGTNLANEVLKPLANKIIVYDTVIQE